MTSETASNQTQKVNQNFVSDSIPDNHQDIVSRVQAWLEIHSSGILAQKNIGEFNGTIMQWFHWYSDNDGKHWIRLESECQNLARLGITAVWLPPAYKGMNGMNDTGYATYDLFDLGEFDQKGSIRTKYGTKSEYLSAIKACRANGIEVYADAVFNHKMGGDYQEEFEAIPLDEYNRHNVMGPVQSIRSWTGFNFPGRGETYSKMKWNWNHFDSVDCNTLNVHYSAVWQVKDKPLEAEVDGERGNYDFLMGCDLDLDHPEVRSELKYWGEWTLDNTGATGFRLDAIKHINSNFFIDWIKHIEQYAGKDIFIVGEFWSYDINTLCSYISKTNGQMSLFDAPLQLKFHHASMSGGHFDMSTIFQGTLMQEVPLLAVTLVENHDTQPLQSLESPVEDWFKPLAYALILLREQGYPCIFYPDYYGSNYSDYGKNGEIQDIKMISHRYLIDRMLLARKHFAYGEQIDYFDDPNAVGWTRLGTELHPHGLAVLMSDGPQDQKWMNVGKPNAKFIDITHHCNEPVMTNNDGWGPFQCQGGSVSIWIAIDAIQEHLKQSIQSY